MRLSCLSETPIDAAEQLKEALGEVNKYYCSQFYGYEVADPEVLLRYYILHGGAKGFRDRHPRQDVPLGNQVKTGDSLPR